MSISTKLIAYTALAASAILALAGCTANNAPEEAVRSKAISISTTAFLNEAGELTRLELTRHESEVVDGLVPKGSEADAKSTTSELYSSESYSESDRKVPFVNPMAQYNGDDKVMTFSDGAKISAPVTYMGNVYTVTGALSWSYDFSYEEFVAFYNAQFADPAASEVNTQEVANKTSDRVWATGKFPAAQVLVGDAAVKTDAEIANLWRQGIPALEAQKMINDVIPGDGAIQRNTSGPPPVIPPVTPNNDPRPVQSSAAGYQYSFGCATIVPVFGNIEDIKAAINLAQTAAGLPAGTISTKLSESMLIDTAEPCALIPEYAPAL